MRQFETGATRNDDIGQLDFEGFLSPLVLERFAEYMHENRVQADGNIRDAGNWQRGISVDSYMSSLLRHVLSLWKIHRGYKALDRIDEHEITAEEACAAVLFNAQGYMFECLSGRAKGVR